MWITDSIHYHHQLVNINAPHLVPQVVPRHAEGHHVQLPVLVRPHHHLHHGDHTYQRLLYGIPGGLLLLPALWWRVVTEADQKDPALLGLLDRLQRLRHHHEEHLVCEELNLNPLSI